MCISEISGSLNIIDKFKNFGVFLNERMKKKKQSNKEHTEFPYYFEDYTKHITIYKNGNGIIINSSVLVVTDIKKFHKIYRKLNIADGKKSSNFPQLEHMMTTEKVERFDKFGFWYYSDENIIDDIKEFYWSDTDKSKEDKQLKGNPKELRWTFSFNKGKIKEGQRYKIIYVISVNGMYPIKDGVIDADEVNDQNSLDENSSEIDIVQDIEHFKYIVSFEDGICLDSTPKCEVCNQRHSDDENTPIPEENEYNILFNKYSFSVDKPILGCKIKTYWKFKQP